MIETEKEYQVWLATKQRRYRETHDRSAEHIRRGIKRRKDRQILADIFAAPDQVFDEWLEGLE